MTGIDNIQRHWSTCDVAPQHALSYWIDTVGQSMLEMEIDSDDRQHFRATLDQAELGPISVNLVQARRHQLRRTPSVIARSPQSVMFLLQLRKGVCRIDQLGRQVDLRVGECVLLDGTEPYHLVCPQETHCLALRLPRDWLKGWLPLLEQHAVRPLSPTSGWTRALSAALSTFNARVSDGLSLPPERVAEQIAALLALASSPGDYACSTRDTLLERMEQTLRERCQDPSLTPDALAREHRISKRYVHHLFAKHGMTFGAELIKYRLLRAERLLGDRRFLNTPIGEISAHCGFSDPSHFARRFREKFGQGPVHFRKATTA